MTSIYRKVSSSIKNKEETMQRLVYAVGKIIKEKGYSGLGLNAIAKEADVSKVLIYRYFGGVDQLVEAYVLRNDYWIAKTSQVEVETKSNSDPKNMKKVVSDLLHGHFEYFSSHPEMRSIIRWEITEQNAVLDSICRVREEVGNLLFDKTGTLFADSKKSIKGVTALMVSAIYYMILHAEKNKSTICGVDLNSEHGKHEILRTIDQIIDWAFEN